MVQAWDGKTQEPQREKLIMNVLTPLRVSISNFHKFHSAAMELIQRKGKEGLSSKESNHTLFDCIIPLVGR